MWDFMREMCGSGRGVRAMPNMVGEGESLLDVLSRRYALGEITREQYQQMKQTLGVSEANAADEHAHH